MIKVELPEHINSKQILALIAEKYPDVEAKIKPRTMSITGSGDNPKVNVGEVILDMKIGSPSEASRVEMELKQAIFDLTLEKTDAEEKQEDNLKELLLAPAFVYILSQIDNLKKEVDNLKEETTKGEIKNENPAKNNPTI
jgi:hypothetical protein